MECSCSECKAVSMALLAAGMLSVKMIVSLHPAAVALVIASRTESSASSVVTFPVGGLVWCFYY